MKEIRNVNVMVDGVKVMNIDGSYAPIDAEYNGKLYHYSTYRCTASGIRFLLESEDGGFIHLTKKDIVDAVKNNK